MSFFNTEKRVAKHTKSEFKIEISKEDMDELHRLQSLRRDNWDSTVKVGVKFFAKDSSKIYSLSWEIV